ncbi:MAG: hypothetical protein NTU69_11680 [Proteobacteria bacterium]|nr:hypothetical protein [Pseudomonadota bacterium]
MWDFFQQIITHPFFGPILGLIGFLIGNRFALDRDKRKEFNNLIEPLRHDLIGIKNHPNSKIQGGWMITVALIREKLPIRKRKGFDKAVENYNKSKSDENIERDNMGGFTYKDTTRIVDAANELLRYLKLK